MVFEKNGDNTELNNQIEPRGNCNGSGANGCYENKVFNSDLNTDVHAHIINNINNRSCL